MIIKMNLIEICKLSRKDLLTHIFKGLMALSSIFNQNFHIPFAMGIRLKNMINIKKEMGIAIIAFMKSKENK